jgi:ABC-type microcin C transport system duplicated ATPase subunit YejF
VFQGAPARAQPVRRVGQPDPEAIDCHAGDYKVDDLLEQVGIPRWRRDAYPHEAVGWGQKQRVMIAWPSPATRTVDRRRADHRLDVMVQARSCNLLADLRASAAWR